MASFITKNVIQKLTISLILLGIANNLVAIAAPVSSPFVVPIIRSNFVELPAQSQLEPIIHREPTTQVVIDSIITSQPQQQKLSDSDRLRENLQSFISKWNDLPLNGLVDSNFNQQQQQLVSIDDSSIQQQQPQLPQQQQGAEKKPDTTQKAAMIVNNEQAMAKPMMTQPRRLLGGPLRYG